MDNIMLDLETMGNGPDAAIIAIGAVEFDLATKQLGREFYQVVDLASSVRYGGVVDPSTVMWWMKQSDEARKAFDRPGVDLSVVLYGFTNWMSQLGDRKDLKVWGNGAAFDNVILASAYRRLRDQAPWEFWNDRCYRTIKAQYPHIKMARQGTYHNALDDAKSQALHLMEMLGGAP